MPSHRAVIKHIKQSEEEMDLRSRLDEYFSKSESRYSMENIIQTNTLISVRCGDNVKALVVPPARVDSIRRCDKTNWKPRDTRTWGYSCLSVLSMCYHTLWILKSRGYTIATPVSQARLIAQRQGSNASPFSGIWIRKLASIFKKVVTGAKLQRGARMQIPYKSLAASKSNGPSKIREAHTRSRIRGTCVPRVLKNRRTRKRSSAAVNSSDIFSTDEVSIGCESETRVVHATKIYFTWKFILDK